MPGHEWMMMALQATWVVFMFAYGACLGSLTNVLVYRLPRGLGVVTPPSRCPVCETKLTWRENIPILGWLMLRGKCRFCRSRISAEYPLVETTIAVLFAAAFAIYYVMPEPAWAFGVDWSLMRPEWARSDVFDGWPRQTWSILVVHAMLLGGLVGMTLVDAKTFTIPLVMPWACGLIGIVFHTGGAVLTELSWFKKLAVTAPSAVWAIPTPGWPGVEVSWWWIGAVFGGVIGLVLSNVFLHFKWLRRSFDDYPEWEREALKAMGIDPDAPVADGVDEGVPVGEHVGPGVRLVLVFVGTWAACLIVLGAFGSAMGESLGVPRWSGLAAGFFAGPILAGFACRVLAPAAVVEPSADACRVLAPEAVVESSPEGSTKEPTSPEMWVQYPHARREMMKEILFLTPCVALAWVFGEVAQRVFEGPSAPLWLLVLAGTLMGALIGGGLVWGIRIVGSVAFGKEAMGLGDVHLMAGVGACLGWVDAALAVPLAAVVALYFVVVSMVANRPSGRALPFGPYLAVATVLVMAGKPVVELGLSRVLAASVNLP